MRILMLAPEPFFEPRGTPFSEYHRIRALLDLGHTVDLVTYPFGEDVSMPGLQVVRCLRPPFVRSVRIGPSWAKVPLDAALTLTACRLAATRRYDAIHSHEEGGLIGVVLASILGVPHLYDMHSSLPQQLENFGFSRSRALRWLFRRMEALVVSRSRVVIVICPHLQDVVRAIDPAASSILIENAPGSGDIVERGAGSPLRAQYGVGADTPVVLYTGTFEAYQGLDLLFESARLVLEVRPDARFLLVGGQRDQVARARAQARAAGVEGATIFVGQRPPEEIPLFLDAADVLVSPRSTGWNTPLKIYQYLRSGKPIVATRLLTHTQVLSDEVAILTEPTARGFADGVMRAIADPLAAAAVAARARHLAETKYTYGAYLDRTRRACLMLSGAATPQMAGGVV